MNGDSALRQELKQVRIDPEMPPVDFVLQPGSKVRIKVVDENGAGIPKARVFFQRWRGRIGYFEFDHVKQDTNDEGIWEWDEAPLDEFEADICRPGGMQLPHQKLKAQKETYVFSPPRLLAVSGKVVDAESGAPIKNFGVVRGLRNKNASIGIDWIESDAYQATNGTYQVTFNRVTVAAIVRVEAIYPGQNQAHTLGASGRNFALVNLEADLAKSVRPDTPVDVAGDKEKRAEWWSVWKGTPEGKDWAQTQEQWLAARATAPFLTASVDRDGAFRLDDTPPGDYVLRVRRDQRLPGTLEQRVKIPAPQTDSATDEIFDLGELRLNLIPD